MSGFFGLFNYDKPGPGIPDDLPPKPKYQVFFEVLFRKFWKLCWLNILYTLVSLPILILLFLVLTNYIYPYLHNVLSNSNVKDIKTTETILLYSINLLLLGSFMNFGIGPTTAGFTYIVRNFAREQHAWIASDFFDTLKKNLKESIIVFFIDMFVLFLFFVNIRFYTIMSQKYLMMFILKYVIIFLFIIYIMMHLFIYPMLITYNLKVRQIFKNAFICSILKLPHTIGILLIMVITILIPFVIFISTGFLLAVFLYFILWVSIVGLIQNFFTNYVFNIYLNPENLNNQENAQQD
ncbi:YesL family protein [Caldicellulosiruptoraceae bacterium PP1]